MKQLSLFSDEEMGLQNDYIKPGNKQPSYPLSHFVTYKRKSDNKKCYVPVHYKPIEVFIAQARSIWGDKYDYSCSVYKSNKDPIFIYCPKHDIQFRVGMAQNHVMKANKTFKPTGCPICAAEIKHNREFGTDWRKYLRLSPNSNRAALISYKRLSKSLSKRLSPEEKERRKELREKEKDKRRELREKEKEQRKREYQEKIEAQKAETKRRNAELKAARHEEWQLKEQQRISELQSYFRHEARKAQGIGYHYRGIKKITNKSSTVMVHCPNPEHHWHPMRVDLVLAGCKCRECAKRHQPREQRYKSFIKKAYKKYGEDMFDLSRVPEQYINNDSYIEIRCIEHDYWYETTPDTFLRKSGGCPICNMSHGEMKILLWLKEHGIKFEREPIIQHNNPNCKREYLKPDFWLPDYNLYIEYNGEQHYKEISYFQNGKNWSLEDQQERDRTLREICKENKYDLLEIPYTEFNRIEEILNEIINLTKKSVSVKP